MKNIFEEILNRKNKKILEVWLEKIRSDIKFQVNLITILTKDKKDMCIYKTRYDDLIGIKDKYLSLMDTVNDGLINYEKTKWKNKTTKEIRQYIDIIDISRKMIDNEFNNLLNEENEKITAA